MSSTTRAMSVACAQLDHDRCDAAEAGYRCACAVCHRPPPRRVVVGGNRAEIDSFLRDQGWIPRECVIVGSPESLRGLRGPVEVHRIGTYWERPAAYIDAVEMNLAVIAATSPNLA